MRVLLPTSSDLMSPGRQKIGFGKMSWKTDPQVTSWLRKNVGVGKWHRSYHYGPEGVFLGFMYRFTEPHDALLFKLVWGGK